MIFILFCTGIAGITFLIGYSQANVTFFKLSLIWNSGAWLADAYAKGRLPKWSRWHLFALVAVFVSTIAASFAGINDFYLNYGWALVSFLLLMLVLGPGARFFTTRQWWVSPLVFVGMVPYSFYLLHFPLFKLAGAVWLQLYGSKPESFLAPTLATVLVIPMA
jgi:peptidoglycan/LPS O-acetylase OafA/YrhL